uniref:Uncharacterized protein n=1 Tax=Parascaris equorum TaxID=6256 RepID=A0A914S1S1_PAREQ
MHYTDASWPIFQMIVDRLRFLVALSFLSLKDFLIIGERYGDTME